MVVAAGLGGAILSEDAVGPWIVEIEERDRHGEVSTAYVYREVEVLEGGGDGPRPQLIVGCKDHESSVWIDAGPGAVLGRPGARRTVQIGLDTEELVSEAFEVSKSRSALYFRWRWANLTELAEAESLILEYKRKRKPRRQRIRVPLAGLADGIRKVHLACGLKLLPDDFHWMPGDPPVEENLFGLTQPRLIRAVEPAWPEKLDPTHRDAKAILVAVVGWQGDIDPERITIVRETPPGMDVGETARAAIQHWEYEPARVGGTPVDVAITIVVSFTR